MVEPTKSYDSQYEEERELGEGGGGTVYLVLNRQDKKKYAAKKIKVESEISAMLQCLEEVKLLSTMKHPNIVLYKEYFIQQEKGLVILIMEYCESGDLATRIRDMLSRNSAFTEQQIWDWFSQICSALSYLKSKKIVHRDLKPLNMFLSGNQIKIGDFGVSKVLVNDSTEVKDVVGTFRYIAPEILNKEPYNTKSDLWAVGCTIYELCTLEKAFNGYSRWDIEDKIKAGQYDPIAADRPYSVKLRKIVDLLLQKDQNLRPEVDKISSISLAELKLENYGVRDIDASKGKYEGQLKDNKRHGYGIMLYASGANYEGEWKNNKKHGKGTYFYASGIKYEGEWRKNKQHGKGTYFYASGDKYEGEWNDDKKHGKGIVLYTRGDKYEGEWKNNKKHGKGTYFYANGAKYEGEWNDDKKHGKGTYFYASGIKYEGEWRDDKSYGLGIYYYANGKKKEGEWKSDLFQKQNWCRQQ